MITRVTIQQIEEVILWKTRVEKIMDYVQEHLSEDLHIATVCRKLDYNKFTLMHNFKEQQKETYREYVERMRMEKAFNLLKEGKWVKEVIPEIGYRNWGTFNIAFKKKYKYAPSFFKK